MDPSFSRVRTAETRRVSGSIASHLQHHSRPGVDDTRLSRIGKRWRRGTRSRAPPAFGEGDRRLRGRVLRRRKGFERHFATARPDSQTEVYLSKMEGPRGGSAGLQHRFPPGMAPRRTAQPWTVNGKTYPAGALLTSFGDYMKAPAGRCLTDGPHLARGRLLDAQPPDPERPRGCKNASVLTRRGEWTSRPGWGSASPRSRPGDRPGRKRRLHDYQRVPHPHQPPGRNSRRHPGKTEGTPTFFDAPDWKSASISREQGRHRVPYFRSPAKSGWTAATHPPLRVRRVRDLHDPGLQPQGRTGVARTRGSTSSPISAGANTAPLAPGRAREAARALGFRGGGELFARKLTSPPASAPWGATAAC